MFHERMCIQNRSALVAYRRNAQGFALLALAVGSLLGALCGCSQAAMPPKSPDPAPPAAIRMKAQAPSGWAFIEGAELPLRLRLPFASEWQRRETKTSLRLEHPATQSQMVVRLWPTSRLVTTEQCLGELALLEPDAALAQQSFMRLATTSSSPGDEDMNFVVSKPFEPGADFHGLTRAAVHPTTVDGATMGIAIAVAAGVGRCLALIATTTVAAPKGEQELADRLAWIVEGTTQSLTVRTVEGRVTSKP